MVQDNHTLMDTGLCKIILIPLSSEPSLGKVSFVFHHFSDFMGAHMVFNILSWFFFKVGKGAS